MVKHVERSDKTSWVERCMRWKVEGKRARVKQGTAY